MPRQKPKPKAPVPESERSISAGEEGIRMEDVGIRDAETGSSDYGFEPNVDGEQETPREFLPREYWPPNRFKPAPYNVVRKMSDEQFQELKRGIASEGLLNGLDARVEDGLTLGGHQRFRACCELIEEFQDDPDKLRAMNLPEGKIPVLPVRGISDARAALLNIRLNNREAQGEFDTANLAALLSDLDAMGHDATLSGFRGEKLTELLTFEEEPDETREESDDVDLALPKTPKTKLGDIYILGRHRLLCGNSTKPEDWDRLLLGITLDGMATDPPYGVAYEGGTADKLTIQNDEITDVELLDKILRPAITNGFNRLKKGGAFYMFAPGGPRHWVFATLMRELKAWRQTISWVKDRFVLSAQDYHWREEPILVGETEDPTEERGEVPERVKKEASRKKMPILYGWKEGARHYFVDDRTQDTFWTVERPSRNAEHPTMKPVELYRRIFRNSSRPGAKWADPFAGSGTAIIAGEQTARSIYAMELDPKYCDVIVHRWEQFAHKEARRIEAGKQNVDTEEIRAALERDLSQ